MRWKFGFGIRQIVGINYAIALFTFCCTVSFSPLRAGESFLLRKPGVLVLHLSGTARERGLRHGQELQSEITQATQQLTNVLPSSASIAARTQELRTLVSAELWEEMLGIAEGSKLPFETILALNFHAPKLDYTALGSCGAGNDSGRLFFVGSWKPTQSTNVRIASETPIVFACNEAGKRQQAWLGLPGRAGCVLGMNSDGICVGGTSSSEKPKTDATIQGATADNAALIARDVLAMSGTIRQVTDVIEKSHRASANRFLIGNAKNPELRVYVTGPQSVEALTQQTSLPVNLSASTEPVKLLAPSNGNKPAPSKVFDLVQKEFSNVARNVDEGRSKFVLDPLAFELWQVALPQDMVARSKSVDPLVSRIRLGDAMLESEMQSCVQTIEKQEMTKVVPEISRTTIFPTRESNETSFPAIYRLDNKPFDAEQESIRIGNGVAVSKVRFPSPVMTPHPENNTVHAEYFRPWSGGKFPCIIVLHIAGGDFVLSRSICQIFAQRGFGCLFVKMPYYGERRPAGGKIKMLSGDLERGLLSAKQTVLDLRRACDWIEAQPQHDGKIGILGVSLGAITGSLASAIEPRISHAALIMGGGNLHDLLFESVEREAVQFRKEWEKSGGSRESFRKVIRDVDPMTFAERLRDRKVLMICAKDDKTVPPKCTIALWEAAGKPAIVWYPCGHYTMARYFAPSLHQAADFFNAWQKTPQ